MKFEERYQLSRVLTASIVNNDVLRDTLIMRDENTKKSYMFDTFRKEVSNTCHDEVMLACVGEKKIEFFNEKELRAIMRENGLSSCRINFYRSRVSN